MLVQFQNTDVVLYRLPDFSDGMLNSDDWNWTDWRQPTQLFTWSSKSQATPGPLFCCSMLNKQLLLKSELNIKRISWLGWGGICVTLCTTIITYSSGFPHHSPQWVWGCVKRIQKPTNQVAVLYIDEVSYWLEAQRAVVVYKLTWKESAAFSIWTTS